MTKDVKLKKKLIMDVIISSEEGLRKSTIRTLHRVKGAEWNTGTGNHETIRTTGV